MVNKWSVWIVYLPYLFLAVICRFVLCHIFLSYLPNRPCFFIHTFIFYTYHFFYRCNFMLDFFPLQVELRRNGYYALLDPLHPYVPETKLIHSKIYPILLTITKHFKKSPTGKETNKRQNRGHIDKVHVWFISTEV